MPSEETKTQVENQTPSPEERAAIKAELEAERRKAQSLVVQATRDLQAKVTALEDELKARQGQLQAALTEAKTFNAELEGARAAYAYAVEDFKKLAASSNPLIPVEAIYGSTVEEVKASLERANALVGKVKEAIAEQAKANPVPAGAPARTGPDAAAMSTKEKINYGLEQAKRRKAS